MKTEALYRIRLASRPGAICDESVECAAAMDRAEFPGCEVADWSRSWLWLATAGDGRKVGYASLRYLPADGFGFFQRAGVLKSHRRQGIHRRFIRCRVALARRMGWRGVLTYTAADNCASANSLAAMGFKLYSPHWRYAGPGFLYFYLPFGE